MHSTRLSENDGSSKTQAQVGGGGGWWWAVVGGWLEGGGGVNV